MVTFSGKHLGFLFVPKEKYNFLFVRFYSKLKIPDPLRKRSKGLLKNELESRIAKRLCITILGNGGIGQPRCVGLFTEFKSYLFNCGESVGRYCREYNISLHLIRHVFITQRKWENISGLADIHISNEVSGLLGMALYGPPGVEQALSMNTSRIFNTKLQKKDGGYIDHTLDIDCIPISSQKEKFFLHANGRRYSKYLTEVEEPDVYCYACRIYERPGDLLPEKLIEYGVPIGPDLLKLKNGESIVLPSGNIVHAKDVHAPNHPEKIILIVDCPSKSFLEPLVNEKQFEKYQTPSSPEVLVFHFTPSDIFKSDKYQDWIEKFRSTTKHIVLNSDNPTLSSNVVHQTVKYFNLLHPTIFSKLRENEIDSRRSPLINDKFIYPFPMMQFHLRPQEEYGWCNVFKEEDDLNIATDGTLIVEKSLNFREELQALKTKILKKSLSNVSKNKYPEVLFLGTSSALSTTYRNVSAILLNTSSDKSILLDCGEGTVLQMTRYFGSELNSALKKISCIFISHKHLDHYLGIFNLISQRIKAFEKSGEPYKKVALILPVDIERIFLNFCEVFENLRPAVHIFGCNYVSKREVPALRYYTGDIELSTVYVKHCTDAWGIVINLGSQEKIVYSGDTGPCQALIDAGKDCTLLIHEASVDDDKLLEALGKKHCTPNQVIDVAEKMNAQFTIMTHFSKRYLAFPILPENCSINVACAFDFMKFRMDELDILPLFTPVLKTVFEFQMEFHKTQTLCVTNVENVFLKKALKS